MAAKNRIVAFDSWTKGSGNLERLADALERRGLELLLIHFGSWGHDADRPKEERLGRILARDISYYGRQPLAEILRSEAPLAVLFLSTQAFVHRAVNRYCAELGVPTLHLFHGLHRVQPTSSRRLNPINLRSQFGLIKERAGKILRKIVPVYAKALWDTRASANDWVRFGYDMWLQAAGRSYTGEAAADASTTACCVYTEGDVPQAVTRYRMPRSAVFAVGNADIIRFHLKESDLGCCLAPDRTRTNEVLYIDTAMIESGCVFASPAESADYLRETKNMLAQQGLRLVVKLHPAHWRTGVPELLDRIGVPQCGNDEFVPRLKSSCAALTEPSSAAIIPALLGLPLLLAHYGKFSGQEYGELLTTYPLARKLDSIDEASNVLHALSDLQCTRGIRDWIYANAGPLPAELMPERVVDIVESISSGRPSRHIAAPAATNHR